MDTDARVQNTTMQDTMRTRDRPENVCTSLKTKRTRTKITLIINKCKQYVYKTISRYSPTILFYKNQNRDHNVDRMFLFFIPKYLSLR